MMTPKQWDMMINGPASKVYIKSSVAHQARAHLATLPENVTISTSQLVEALYPRDVADLSLAGDTARKMIYGMVARLATDGLEDCCVKGPVCGQFMGRPKRPWLWFHPPACEVCFACGQILPKEDVSPRPVQEDAT